MRLPCIASCSGQIWLVIRGGMLLAAGKEDVNYEGTGVNSYLPDKLNQDRQPWPNAVLHRQVVDAALSGAKAMAAHQDGLLSTVGLRLRSVGRPISTYLSSRKPGQGVKLLHDMWTSRSWIV